jgi:hypothetical protein
VFISKNGSGLRQHAKACAAVPVKSTSSPLLGSNYIPVGVREGVWMGAVATTRCATKEGAVRGHWRKQYWISNQARLPAEFKHITKRRKRN